MLTDAQQNGREILEKEARSVLEHFVGKVVDLIDEVPDTHQTNPAYHLFRLFLQKITFASQLLLEHLTLCRWHLQEALVITYPARVVFLPDYYSFLFRLTPF